MSSMKRGLLAALAFSTLCAAAQPSADVIVKRSVANTMADWDAAPRYTFTERDVVTKKTRSIKTYRVIMIDGSPYNKLIKANGEPLTPEQVSEQNRALQHEMATRKRETPGERRKRIEQYQRERRQDHALMQEMMKAIHFRLTGEDTVEGRRCFVLEGTPNPGYRPISRETKVLKGMRGKLWIDEQQYQWVKVETEVFRPVAFGLFIAHVEPGTQFTLEQRPVEGGFWLPSHFSMRVKAKVLGSLSRNYADDETYWNYSRIS